MKPARLDLRNSLVCGSLALLALLAAWPFSGLPFNDDWTWAFTVQKLNQSGHLVYNGWSSPPVIAQAYWGLLWVKLFGFSFNVLHVSCLPLAIGAVVLCYLLGRLVGLTAGLSMFAALLLGLSPLYMPLECTFMTDAPGLFFMLLSMIALVRSFESRKKQTVIFWTLLGVTAALVGGSSRQLVWIVPLVVLPYFAVLRRPDYFYIFVSALAWIAVLGGAAAMQHWYYRQPYALPDPPLLSYWHALLRHPKQCVVGSLCVMLTMGLVLLPALLGTIRCRFGRIEVLALFIAAAMLLLLHRAHRAVEPWMGNILSTSGPMGSVEIAGGTPVVLGSHVRLAISLVVMAGIAMLMSIALMWIYRSGKSASPRLVHFFFVPLPAQTSVAGMLILSMAMFALELTRVISEVSYDRHLLAFIPFVSIPLLFGYQRAGVVRMPLIAWGLLMVFGIYGIASTQEINALSRARAAAIGKLETAGIAAKQIDGGFEHNYWTQVQLDGHINDVRIQNPRDAYRSDRGPTPDMHVLYRLESRRTAVTTYTSFGTQDYFSFLPPFHRRFYIDRFVDPWWLDPAKAATRPVEKSLIPQALLDQYPRRY
jgi:hypothetical protein